MDFAKLEEETLRHWQAIDVFATQLQLTDGCEPFTFYDGPPFATGLPHYGHLLASTIKDIVPRYWSMKGRHVARRFGWDTHGVPIEFEIDKKFGKSAREVVKEIGVEKYNAECRAIVMRYADMVLIHRQEEWRHTITRLGRFVDFDNDYKTMDVKFMESVWWVFKQLFDKGSVYRAYSIMPFSTALCTPLSFMESKQNEKQTNDPAVWVSFPILGRENCSLVIYTTTPWTLPSNLFVACHPELEYCEIEDIASKNRYILLETGIADIYKSNKSSKKKGDEEARDYRIVNRIRGKDMAGWKYEALFPYFKEQYPDCFLVYCASYVEAGEGTGLVHQAPAFGQEDYDAAVEAGFITPERLPPCPVDDAGLFTHQVPDYAGQHVKLADKAIVKHLKHIGRLLHSSQIVHVDKFCWRSDTQLIRKAVSSWFIRVTDSIPEMLQNLESTRWVPAFVKEKRFANWVANAHDWNVGRNRYWGTPIPLWVSPDFEEVVCVGSIAELKELSGWSGPLDDIHRDKVDNIEIPSKRGYGMLRRVDEVFDCWFESGSMPYASNHFPFALRDENDFHHGMFPADFIAEGLDQTRGWFYTLTVLGNKLFGKSPFRAVIVNGLVLAEDGKKMSKSLKNYPDPMAVVNKFGSDALRLYLVNSPVVRGEPLRFQEAGVKETVAKVLLPLWNSYRFLSEQALLYKTVTGNDFRCTSLSSPAPAMSNVMDRWILADCQSMLRFIDQEMAAYRLYTVVPRLLAVMDNITNWYIRFNRRRLKGTAALGQADTETALNTLSHVLFTLVRALAPFIPFLTDHIYKLLKPTLAEALTELGAARTESIHFLRFPTVQESLLDPAVEGKMAVLQKVISLTRTSRERRAIPLKTPLLTLVVIADAEVQREIEDAELQTYIREELNVRDLVLTADEDKYKIRLQAKVDWPRLGKKLKKDAQVVRKALPSLTQGELRAFMKEGKMDVSGIRIEEGDVTVVRVLEMSGEEGGDAWEPAFTEDGIIILLDTTPHPELAAEALARDVISAVQKMRKKAGLVPTDHVHMRYDIVRNPDSVPVEDAFEERQEQFVSSLRGRLEKRVGEGGRGTKVLEEEYRFGDLVLMLELCKLT